MAVHNRGSPLPKYADHGRQPKLADERQSMTGMDRNALRLLFAGPRQTELVVVSRWRALTSQLLRSLQRVGNLDPEIPDVCSQVCYGQVGTGWPGDSWSAGRSTSNSCAAAYGCRKPPGRAQSTTGRRLDISVGDGFLGRVVDPLGCPLDGRPLPHSNRRRAHEVFSPPITARDFVDRPLLSGSKMVDTMIPIGKGQRQLVIGDAGTGKSALALDTVIAQRGRDVLCVYVPATIRHWD